MRKAITILMCSLFALTALYPAGIIVTACIGYTFRLASVSAFAAALAVLSFLTVYLDIDEKGSPESNVLRVLLAVITPLSLINAVCYIFACPQFWVAACVLVSAGCCCFLTVKHGKPKALKIVALAIAGLMALPIGFMALFAPIFGNIGQDTVVQSVESPSGKYCACVIDSDQGGLGGDTFVNVYEKGGIDVILFKIEKKPQRVYSGQWGEFRDMQIYWKDDGCLVINSAEYQVK